jgi:hypothetical protein
MLLHMDEEGGVMGCWTTVVVGGSPNHSRSLRNDLLCWLLAAISKMGTLNKMKREYTEGPEALEKFKRGMIALFKVPKEAIGEGRKKGRKLTAPRKKKRPDKD